MDRIKTLKGALKQLNLSINPFIIQRSSASGYCSCFPSMMHFDFILLLRLSLRAFPYLWTKRARCQDYAVHDHMSLGFFQHRI